LSGDDVLTSPHRRRGGAARIGIALALLIAAAAGAQETTVVLPITINEVSRGETAVLMTGDDIFVPLATLERGGLAGPMWERLQLAATMRAAEKTIEGQRAVSLKSLAPWGTFAFDENALTLSVTFRPDLMMRRSFAISNAKPADISYRSDPSGFFNYAATTTGRATPSFFGETGVSLRGGLAYTAFSQSPGDGFRRGISNVSFDQRNVLRRWTAGDAAVFSDELGGSGLVGGITVARIFDIDPYFIRYPSVSLRGVATTPSQVEVYVNGALVSRQTIEPGPFDIQNLPAIAGPTNAQIVVRDVFGREQSQSSSFYYSTAVLGRGISDYVYSAGFLREQFSRSDFAYGKPVLLGFHRYGITNNLTVGGRVEASEHLFSGGPTMSFGSRLADMDLRLAASSSESSFGSAAQLAVRRLSRRAQLSAIARVFSSEYENFSLDASMDRPLREGLLSASYLLKWVNVGAQWSAGEMRDSGRRTRLAFLASVPIANRMDAMLTAATTKTANDQRLTEYFAGVSYHGFGRTTVNVGAARAGTANGVTAEVQQPLGLGDGWGYRLQTTSGLSGATTDTNGSAAVQYQNRYGRYELTTPLRDAELSARVAGGVVFQGGRIMPTRPVAQSFALVRVPGVDNVRVYLSNQVIGRTDARGDLLLSDLLSYYGNRIRIDDRDVPMTYDVQVIEQTIAPPNRGGALVVFPVRSIRTVTGSVGVKRADGTSFVPAYGQITVTGGSSSVVSPLGGEAEFYFENLSAGAYRATLEYEHGSCTFPLEVPESKNDVIELGRIVCTETSKP
jgi:outer membrane usher protein